MRAPIFSYVRGISEKAITGEEQPAVKQQILILFQANQSLAPDNDQANPPQTNLGLSQ